MALEERRYRWEWRLRASPEALWPLVADTNRFNRDAGVPPVDPVSGPGAASGAGRRRLRLYKLGLPVEWIEDPFEWLWPSRFGVVRRYTRGPVAELRVLVTLTPRDPGGTDLVYEVWARPRNLLGVLAIPVEIGRRARSRFEATIRRYDAEVMARQTDARAVDVGPPGRAPAGRLAPGGAARIAAAAEALRREGCPAELVGRLIETIERADDLSLSRLRPYALADRWGAPRRAVLELCLLATRAGLLDLSWDLLCPLCRGAKASHSRLGDVDPDVHCDSCRIDFRADFDRLVELTFHPGRAVRPVERVSFCVGGPGVTPHVVLQQLVPPGDSRSLSAPLEPGRYRVRALGRPGARLFQVEGARADGSATPAMVLTVTDEGWPEGEAAVGPHPTLRLANATATEALVIVERLRWADEGATAAEVTALQRFRDLFASDVLRPGEQIAVGSLAFLFTDLRGSTRLYREVGDASAFGRVMSHFDVLREAVAQEGGAIVKTMGDAIMAAFPRPAGALRAALAAQRALGGASIPPAASGSLRLRAGIHAGPCIAVTQNDRLDYFGSVVNIAARLEGFSQGGDVVLSAAVRDDPEVAEWLGRPGAGLSVASFEGTLKGFDTERFALWRVSADPAGKGPC